MRRLIKSSGASHLNIRLIASSNTCQKKVFEQTATIAQKFVTDNRDNHPILTVGNVIMKWILLKYNIHLDTHGDIEEHTAHTHGININKLKLMIQRCCS